MINPFFSPLGGSRRQFTQPQNQFNQQQNQYDFSGWGDRLNKIEEGIASLTNQFNNFQTPGDVAPEYTGNAAPEPLEQSANALEPLGGIESLMEIDANTQPSNATSFTLGSGDPRDAYMEAMGIQGTPTNVLESMGLYGMGQKDKDPMGWMNQPSRPISPLSQHLMDGEWRQLTPEEFGTKFPNSPFNQNGIPQNTGYVPEPYTGGDRGLAMQAGMNLPGAGGRPSDLQQPIQQGVGLAGLYQQNKGPGI